MAKKLLMVYGTLRRGEYNNYLIKKQKCLGLVETEDKFKLINHWGLPVVDMTEGVSTIKGDLYEVDKETWKTLENLERYPDWYDRSRVKVLKDGVPHEAHIYHINSYEHDPDEVVDSGDWKDRSNQDNEW